VLHQVRAAELTLHCVKPMVPSSCRNHFDSENGPNK